MAPKFQKKVRALSRKKAQLMNNTFSFTAIGINFVGGAVIDFCRKRFATIERPSKGTVIGFFISQESN